MISREINLLDEYGLHVERTGRGRGGTIYYCKEGVYLLKPCPYGEKRAETLFRELAKLQSRGFRSDIFVRNKEGNLPVTDGYQNVFILREWFDAVECEVTNPNEVLRGVYKLVQLQEIIRECSDEEHGAFREAKTTEEQLKKHSRELKYIHNYIRGKNHKTAFEEELQRVFDRYQKEAARALQILENVLPKECAYQLCHKDYTHHNLLMEAGEMIPVSYDGMAMDCRVSDFCQFLRKVMEKNEWDAGLGERLVQAYLERGRLSPSERLDLYARMVYPMGFWRVVNQYSATKRSRVNLRTGEKLAQFLSQEESRQQFLVFLHKLIV